MSRFVRRRGRFKKGVENLDVSIFAFVASP